MDSPRSFSGPIEGDDLVPTAVSVAIGASELHDEVDAFSDDRTSADAEISSAFVPWDIERAELWGCLGTCSLREKLRRWFAGVVPTRVDIITHLEASSERFLIHAESLILRLVMDPTYRTDFLQEPQTLRLLYCIESFLESLRQCRAMFCVVFLDCYIPLLEEISPLLCAARQTFLLQCKVADSPLLEFAVFPDWMNEDFVTFVRASTPPFILIDDCTDLDLTPIEGHVLDDGDDEVEGQGDADEVEGQGDADEVEGQGDADEVEGQTDDDDDGSQGGEGDATGRKDSEKVDVSQVSIAFIAGCLRLHLQVAVFSGLERKGRKVYCFALQPTSLPSPVLSAVVQLENKLVGQSASDNVPLNDLLETWNTFTRNVPHPKYVGIRELLTAVFLRDDIASSDDASSKDEEDSRDLAIVLGITLLLVSQVTRSTPLSARALRGFDWEDDDGDLVWEFSETLDGMLVYYFKELLPWLTAILSEDSTRWLFDMYGTQEKQQLQRDVADLFDARLFKIVVTLAAREIETQGTLTNAFWGLPQEALDEISELLRTVVKLKNVDANALCDPELLRRVLPLGASKLSVKAAPLSTKAELLPLRSSFFEKLIQKSDPANLLPETTLCRCPPEFDGTEFYNARSKDGVVWTCGVAFDVARHEIQVRHASTSTPVPTWGNLPDDPRLRRKMMLRMAQKGAATVSKFASSLVGSNAFGTSIRVCPPGTHVWEEQLQTESFEAVVAPSAQKKTDTKKGKKPTTSELKEGGKKLSSKAEAIVKANQEAQKKKQEETDSERLRNVLSSMDTIASKSTSPGVLHSRLLDALIGHVRFTDELGTFPGVTSYLKLPSSHRRVLTHVATVLTSAITKQFGKIPSRDTEALQELHRLQCFAFQFCQTYFKMYNGDLNHEDIQEIQRLLLSMGFTTSAKSLFQSWKTAAIESFKKSLDDTSGAASSSTGVGNKPSSKGKGKSKQNGGSAAVGKGGVSKTKQHASLMAFTKTLDSAYVDPGNALQCMYHVPAGFEAEVQLKFMGHLMERSLGSAPDPRVGFCPDAWQRRLLDVVDQRRSALVCAPTGCGKTFACYYAMEKVLTLDNESVVVFVCPAKALVQQVNHEIAARFRSKEYPFGSDATLAVTMLREMHDGKAMSAQIVITLPALLEMLFMSPEYRDWVARVKYVILDEIHCIGESEEEGQAWERLIQLMPCPFLALSATIGNPGSFHQWLGAAHVSADKLRRDNKPAVEVIHFNERYADLSCYVYADSVPAPPSFDPPEKEHPETSSSTPALLPLNPFVCMTYHQLKMGTVARDFYAPSADILQAYMVLRNVLLHYYSNENLTAALDPIDRAELDVFTTLLTPNVYFQGSPFISKRQYRYYLNCFTSSFTFLVQRSVITEELLTTVNALLMASKSVNTIGEVTGGTLWDPRLDTTLEKETLRHPLMTESPLTRVLNASDVRREFLDISKTITLCRRLQALGLLPALMFNLDRSVVDYLGQHIVLELMKMQHDKYYGSPEAAANTKAINKKRMDAYKAKVKFREEMLKMKALTKEQREEQGISDDIERELAEALPPPPIDIAEEYDPEFSFCNRRIWGTRHDDIQEILDGCRRKYLATPQNKIFLEGLMRGIGYHHNGLSRRQRNAVEMLFRMGYLTIVIATETLSLGVNMPCKTTVFLGDNITLTPLIYRQTAGRAGRRGFDVLGHIVFWNMPYRKLRRLICSPLPVLSGGFPVTPTTVLRTYQMINGVRRNQRERMAAALGSIRPAQQKTLALQLSAELDVLEGCLQRLYKVPFFSVSTVDAKPDIEGIAKLRFAVRYAFRFAADLLCHNFLLDTSANCTGLAGLANALYEGEPGNVALNALLLSSCLHERLTNEQRCSPQEPSIAKETLTDRLRNIQFFLPSSERTAFQPLWQVQELMTAFAYCFGSVPLSHNVFLRMEYDSQFDPLLPAFPEDVWRVLEKQDALILRTATGYLQTVAEVYRSADELTLPLSMANFKHSATSLYTADASKQSPSSLHAQLSSMKLISRARSPFTAICGRPDLDFSSAAELFNSKPYAIPLDSSFVPQFTARCVTVNFQKRPLFSNYILSFLSSMNMRRTAMSSNISPNALYYALRDFHERLYYTEMYTTAAIKASPEKDVFVATLADARRLLEWQINKVAA